MNTSQRAAVLVTFAGLWCAPAGAGDWPRFRGLNGSGIGDTVELPATLAPDSALWKTEVPFGHSSPILVGSRIFLTGLGDDGLLTIALDAGTGAEVWRRAVPRLRIDKVAPESGPAVATPVAGADTVYAFFPEFGLVAYGFGGEERWRLQMPPFDSFYGMGSSPVLEGGVLVLVCDQSRKPFIVGIDAATGKELWRRNREVRAESWTTPVVHRTGTTEASILVFGTFNLDAYDPRTGTLRWRLPGFGFTPVASPVIDGDRVFAVAPDQGEAPLPTVETTLALDGDGDGRLTETEMAPSPVASAFHWIDMDGDGAVTRDEYAAQIGGLSSPDHGLVAVELGMGPAAIVWRQQRTVPYIATPIVYQGVLFLVNDGGILTSYDPKTGAILKRGRIEGAVDPFSPSPVAAGGNLYLASSDGTLAVVAARGDWEKVATYDLDEPIHATPAIGDGRIYVRTRSRLYAFGPRD